MASRHPWVFRRMVSRSFHETADTPSVDVYDRDGRFLGLGIYSPLSQVAVRIVGNEPGQRVDSAFLAERFRAARQLREETLKLYTPDSTAYRLVNSEGDGLSGLIIDRFDNLFVADIRARGWFDRRLAIESALCDVFGDATRVAFTTAPGVERAEGFELPVTKSASFSFAEHGLQWRVETGAMHKTGFFLDQRESRALIRSIAAGRTVLDCCCYGGGFSLNAAAAGAAEVIGVDLDEEAVGMAKRNATANKLKVKFVHADAFPYLRDRSRVGNLAQVLVLDPPKLIRDRDSFMEGLRTYHDLNRTALTAVADGGFFLSFSCSGLLPREEFLHMVTDAAARATVNLQILRELGPGADHPWLAAAPESRYLKGVLGRVLR
jgi:23S rRNA (cytosine1962-C5)-methyltransferase